MPSAPSAFSASLNAVMSSSLHLNLAGLLIITIGTSNHIISFKLMHYNNMSFMSSLLFSHSLYWFFTSDGNKYKQQLRECPRCIGRRSIEIYKRKRENKKIENRRKDLLSVSVFKCPLLIWCTVKKEEWSYRFIWYRSTRMHEAWISCWFNRRNS